MIQKVNGRNGKRKIMMDEMLRRRELPCDVIEDRFIESESFVMRC
jgi:hypothetical protein